MRVVGAFVANLDVPNISSDGRDLEGRYRNIQHYNSCHSRPARIMVHGDEGMSRRF
jgi:hypothetical protein